MYTIYIILVIVGHAFHKYIRQPLNNLYDNFKYRKVHKEIRRKYLGKKR